MANARPKSMIIPSNVFDEANTNNVQKKRSTTINQHSSSSSIDSNSIQNMNVNEQNSSPQTRLTSTTSSTTTDSDFESEQDENVQYKQQKNVHDHSSRRLKHFHKLFQSELNGDMPDLIDSYVCAYQGDILLQGKMYITDRYLCFHSRIINYITKHVYRWEQIECVSKERVAFIFPTAIGIQLKQTGKKITYASFLTRDQAYEKIQSVWFKSTNGNNSYDDNDLAQDGTLKANHHNKRDSYDIIEAEEEEVLQMCLKQNGGSHKQRISSISSKSSDEKQKTKKLSNKNSIIDQKLTNDINENQTKRNSRCIKNEQKQKDKTRKNSPVANHQSQSASANRQQSRSSDRTLTPVHQTSSQSNSTSNVIPNTNSSLPNTNHIGLQTKAFNIIISFLNLIIQNILSLIKYIQAYPVKITIIILLFVTILFFHSFYLIKLANRIETRLQSLHHLLPPSPIRHSFSSNSKEL